MSKVFLKPMALLLLCFMTTVVLTSCTKVEEEVVFEPSDKPLVIELYSSG